MEKEQGLKGYIRQNRAELFREIEDLIQNEDVTDIEWDGYYLWVTDLKKGCYCHNIRLNEEYVDNLAIRLANIMKVPFNRAYPILEANTEDLRISIWHESRCTKKSMAIRKIPTRLRFRHQDIVQAGYAPETLINLLENCVTAHCNIVIGGQPHAGKTELLKYLSTFIPANEKVGVYEDNQEIHYRKINPGKKCAEFFVDEKFSYSQIIRAGLRHNIDWTLLSESRGPEVLDLLNSLSTGASCMTTIHLDDVRGCRTECIICWARVILQNASSITFTNILMSGCWLSAMQRKGGGLHRWHFTIMRVAGIPVQCYMTEKGKHRSRYRKPISAVFCGMGLRIRIRQHEFLCKRGIIMGGSMKKIKYRNVRQYFSYRRIQQKAGESGAACTPQGYAGIFGAVMVITVLTGWFYRLQPIWIFMVMAAGILCIPAVTATYFSGKEKKKKFHDVDVYIHQMIYSFERQPKILTALEDTLKVTDHKMKNCIIAAIQEMQYGTTKDVYRMALKNIEKEYACSRITTLHTFLTQVEEKGGEYKSSLEILRCDADHWVKRVYQFQEEIRRIKQTTAIGVVLSFLMASVSVLVTYICENTSEIRLDITHEPLYQVVSCTFLILCMMYYTYMQIRHDCDWLVKQRSDKAAERDYQMAFHTDLKKLHRSLIPILVIMAGISGILAYYGWYLWCAVAAVCGIYLWIVPQINRQAALKRLRKDLYYSFADWLRDVALNLSEESLAMAIEDTYDTAPVIMKESLEQFIYAIEENPSDVTPYYSFLNQFEVTDISSSVRILYSLSENDAQSIDTTIKTLLTRNYELMNQYETADNADHISIMRFSEYIPTFFVAVKVAADMLLVITNYL